MLNGGEEFTPGNEPQDEALVEAAGGGPAFVLTTAAARRRPELAAQNAIRWFARLGLEVRQLPVHRRSEADGQRWAAQAEQGTFFYLVGGDPGHTVGVLRESAVWRAMLVAWRRGAALAGSSAGAMALCDWTLVRARWPHHDVRRAVPALGVVPRTAVLPHYERFGRRWAESPIEDAPRRLTLLGLDERTAAVWDGRGWTALGAGSVTVGRVAVRAGAEVAGLPRPRGAAG